MKSVYEDNAESIGNTLAYVAATRGYKLTLTMPDMVPVQLNGTIVDRNAFPAMQVRENDSVDFLYFMGGGGHR